MYETQLRASFKKELENASKLKTQGMGGNSAFYVACHGSKTDPLDCHFEYDELCRKARMSGVDCDANSKALENAIKKELGLPTVSISPGEQRVPGVLEPGGDVYKQWYSIPRENNTDRSIPDVLKAALDIEKASVPETIQKEPEDGSVVRKNEPPPTYYLLGDAEEEALGYISHNLYLNTKLLEVVS
eukprot:jgi/Mesvir1/29504/Mv07002-RA.1